MDTINFTAQSNFPLSTNVMQKLQSVTKMLQDALASLIGPDGANYKVQGCLPDSNGNIQPGIVSIAGELMPFTGGVPQAYVEVVETSQTLTAGNNAYPNAVVTRYAQFAPAGVHLWDDFRQMVYALFDLQGALDATRRLYSVPVGCILPYAGDTGSAPYGYLWCLGQYFDKTQYGDLYGVLKSGNPFLPEQGNLFQVPDLRKSFLLGYHPGTLEYQYAGMRGDVPSSLTETPGNTNYVTVNYIIRALV